ncbi:heparinase II/III family protein [Pendulispora albinea]|uniref:Heparinase II/III family protein n=1 Tax=Pendulispora albinea TaxID=2741071 RepID=A0ABZ2M156_9BACT
MNAARLFVGAICLGLSLGPIGACKRVVKGCIRGDGIKPAPAPGASSTSSTTASDSAAAAGAASGKDLPELVPLPALARLGGHPRILLTPARRARMKRLAAQHAPAWTRQVHLCEEASAKRIPSGYEGWDWTNAALACALVAYVEGDESAARTGVIYLRALADDKAKVGDGQGGDTVVRHDQGYSIRTRGFLGALAYDWLHDAPGVDAELRNHMVDRFASWIDWYGREGYMRDKPVANYYAGYFGAVSMAGIAADGDDPRATKLRAQAQRMFLREVVPAFARIEGGQWPESWQYGAGPAITMAIYTATEHVKLPWLTQIVPYRTHALQPDGLHIYDNGDWSEKPAVAGAAELDAVALAFDRAPGEEAAAAVAADGSTPGLVKQAHALTTKTTRRRDDPFGWVTALTDDATPQAKSSEEDPRRGPTSYLAAGTGTLFARTAWSPDAVWASFQSGPHLSDHQHLDQGHFELTRGADALLIDPSAYGSGSSASHNTLLIDDSKETLVYAPNQVPVSRASITRFSDAGTFVHALGDFTSAYEPPHFQDDGKRSVTHAEREIVFSRSPVGGANASARLVVYDRVSVTKPTFAVTWAAHTAGNADIAGATTRFAVGESAAHITTIAPAEPKARLVHEPDPEKNDSFWTNNAPAKNLRSTRLEIPSPTGGTDRRFLHVIAVTSATSPRPQAVPLRGDAIDGAALDGEAYVFLRSAIQTVPTAFDYTAPEDATRHIISGLVPGAAYVTTASRAAGGCKIALNPGGAGAKASDAGVLVVSVASCGIK